MTGHSGCDGLPWVRGVFVASLRELQGSKSVSNVSHSSRVKASGETIIFVYDARLRGAGIENAEESSVRKGWSIQPKGEERSAVSEVSMVNFDVSTTDKDVPSCSIGLGVLRRGMSQISEFLKDHSPCMAFADEMIMANGLSNRRRR